MVILRNRVGENFLLRKGAKRKNGEQQERAPKVRGGATQAKMKLQVFDGIMGDYWTDQLALPISTERMKKSEISGTYSQVTNLKFMVP